VSPYPHRLRGGGAGSIPDRVEESLEPLDLGVEGIGGAEPEQESDVGIGVGVLLLQCESAGGDGAAHGAQPLQSQTQLQMQVSLQGDEGGGRRGGRGAGRLGTRSWREEDDSPRIRGRGSARHVVNHLHVDKGRLL
jgi:hypothetical protein